jgi:hypothetical protein
MPVESVVLDVQRMSHHHQLVVVVVERKRMREMHHQDRYVWLNWRSIERSNNNNSNQIDFHNDLLQ